MTYCLEPHGMPTVGPIAPQDQPRHSSPRPSKKWSGCLVGAMLAAVILIIASVAMWELIKGSSSEHDIPTGRPPTVAITAGVTLSRLTISVQNLDTFDWPLTTIWLNGIVGGYRYERQALASGATIRIPLREFVTASGEWFDPDRRKPVEVIVHSAGYDARQFKY